MLNLVLDQSWD